MNLRLAMVVLLLTSSVHRCKRNGWICLHPASRARPTANPILSAPVPRTADGKPD